MNAEPKDSEALANDRGGSSKPSHHRRLVSFGLWAWGSIALLGAMLSSALQIAVPMFSLENEQWRRSDNPHKFANVCICFAMGIAAIYAARSSDRTRFMMGLAVVVGSFVYGLYFIGVFNI